MLQGIGFFITSLDDADFPCPQELVGPDTRLHLVADYLDRGAVYERYRGVSWCRFDCDEDRMGSCDLTDGSWIWPQGLSHYLRHHSVRLPEEFMEHALSGAQIGTAPPGGEPDYTFWIEWAFSRRSHPLRQRLQDAREEEARLCDLARDEAIRAEITKHGEGDRVCLQAGCSRRALQSMALCAHHLPEMSLAGRFSSQSLHLLRLALRNPSQ